MTPHTQRLERWLGADCINALSRNFATWYGPPVALAGVPGAVYVTGGGDFTGPYRGHSTVSADERVRDWLDQERRRRFSRMFPRQRGAFSGLSALIAAKTGGKGCTMNFTKAGTAPTAISGAMDAWMYTGVPVAGAAGAAAPGGTAHTSANTGALAFVNAVANANTSHFTNAYFQSNVAFCPVVLYDRLLSVAKTMNSTATEAVTGTFSRYQNQTSTAEDYIGGNFCFPADSGTVLPATAHNWTVCQYTNQAGTTGQSFASTAGISADAVNQIDLVLGTWYLPLASGDVGVKALTQMQCSALVATGTIHFVVGHPIAVFPNATANAAVNIDGVASAFNLTRVYDNACLSFIELPRNAASAATWGGNVTTVSE